MDLLIMGVNLLITTIIALYLAKQNIKLRTERDVATQAVLLLVHGWSKSDPEAASGFIAKLRKELGFPDVPS